MKRNLLVIVLFVFTFGLQAQKWSLGAHMGMALPTSDATTYSAPGFSWDVEIEHRIKPQFAITAQFGMNHWGNGSFKYFYDYGSNLGSGRYIGSTDWTYLNTGIQGGLGFKYYLVEPIEGLSYYLGLQVNYQYIDATKKMVDQGFVSIGSPNPNTSVYSISRESSGSHTGVEIRPQVGAMYTFSSGWNMSFSAWYGYSTVQWDNSVEVDYMSTYRQSNYSERSAGLQEVYLKIGGAYSF